MPYYYQIFAKHKSGEEISDILTTADSKKGAEEYGRRCVPARLRGGDEGLGLRAEPDRQAQGERPFRGDAGVGCV